ncbi:CD63 antigen-like [Oopsacas minuta]|uniref:Tetraspanin n=1 Tax=Oopsacas minuta TaxID=111878 RepID=A0AAV7JT99_9METZ|nr:CD63 antigen-like [Oopsacas minuta]
MRKFCRPYERTDDCLKTTLFIYNMLFWFMGLGLVAVGLYLFLEQNEFSGITRFFFLLPAIFVLASGFSMLCLGLLAICGIMRHSRLFLAAFCLVTLIVSGILLAAGAFGISLLIGEDLGVRSRATSSLSQYTNCSNTRTSWDLIHREFNCCGIYGPEDWSQLSSSLGYVPSSCCKIEGIRNCGLVRSSEVEIFEDGCLSSLISYEHRQLVIASGVCLIVSMFNLMGSLLSFILIINFSNKVRED